MAYSKEEKKKYDKIYRAENKETIVAYKKKWYLDNKQHALLESKKRYEGNRDEEQNQRQRWLKVCRRVQGSQCVRCSSMKKLEFHHVIPVATKFRVSHARNLKDMLYESYKCTLLCKSCHKTIHLLMKSHGVRK